MLEEKLKKYRLILASGSPRRRELLSGMGLDFEVIPSDTEEEPQGEHPGEIVMHLARQKAQAVYQRLAVSVQAKPLLVIGADTVVVIADEIMGKPASPEEAYNMLSKLSGNTHQVYTGVHLMGDNQSRSFYVQTDVSCYALSEAEKWEYIKTKDPFDKAGGYGIQGSFGVYVEKICGDYNNVVGLPVSRLYQELKQYC